MIEYTIEIALWLSLKDALLGEVDNNLRMVALLWDDLKKTIEIRFYFDKEVNIDNLSSGQNVATKVRKKFSQDTLVIPVCLQLNSPAPLPYYENQVFRRKEA